MIGYTWHITMVYSMVYAFSIHDSLSYTIGYTRRITMVYTMVYALSIPDIYDAVYAVAYMVSIRWLY